MKDFSLHDLINVLPRLSCRLFTVAFGYFFFFQELNGLELCLVVYSWTKCVMHWLSLSPINYKHVYRKVAFSLTKASPMAWITLQWLRSLNGCLIHLFIEISILILKVILPAAMPLRHSHLGKVLVLPFLPIFHFHLPFHDTGSKLEMATLRGLYYRLNNAVYKSWVVLQHYFLSENRAWMFMWQSKLWSSF